MRSLDAHRNELKDKAETVKSLQTSIQQLEAKSKLMIEEKDRAHERMSHEYSGNHKSAPFTNQTCSSHLSLLLCLSDPDEELQAFGATFRNDLEATQTEMNAQREQLREAERKAQRFSAQHQEAVKTLGRLEAQEQELIRKKSELQSVSARLAEQYDVQNEAKAGSSVRNRERKRCRVGGQGGGRAEVGAEKTKRSLNSHIRL
jgi:hypothetical protein